ncbi:HXXEE domain-containing protein [Brevibacillus fulvus]|uniref:HXXEE domain-containing protein n=1 Tax=Brevibacillus fulvus TaxID=1125967 RepID=A0A938XVJ6_9BACL|nr:HXXEE domain-containing protein [Brevibacillus fulvus]MBM7591263.1 hypothetical protein [Brevibacillus fulvus]
MLDIQTLIWLFPIVFIVHDLEEIVTVEKWIKRNRANLYEKLPRKWAERMIRQFSLTTAQFAVSVLVIFLLISCSALMASQYVNHAPVSDIYLFLVCQLVFFVHAFVHIGQALFFRSFTPGVITSIVIILPYSTALFQELFARQMITWETIAISIPFAFLFFPFVLFAHWLGKRVA